jgi:protein-L-isoaspartate(D-aspartate) O-methyltransferase
MIKHSLYDFYRKLDRSLFMDNEFKDMSAIDRPLPIGFGQTISQPTLVLQMTSLLAPDKSCRVLEIGTGSGYQTAFLAHFSGEVYTVERIPELLEKARERLETMGYRNIHYKTGDGSEGWEEYAPYDRIMVTAAPEKLPEELVCQLAPGGKMLIPVGPKGRQDLLSVEKDERGMIHMDTVEKVMFVEMKGKYGWS